MSTVEAIAENPAKKSAKNSAPVADASPERMVAWLIGVFLVFHLILAATLGLGVDECYAIGVAHDLKLFYFDHPPLHYWIAHVFMPLLGDGRALRLPFIAIFVATTWSLFLLTRQLFGAAAGVWAVLALNLSAFFTLTGGWVVPDGPLMLCLTAAAYTIARGLFPVRAPPSASPWRTWIIAGLWIGLAGLSKYHAALFVVGLFIYVVSSLEAAKFAAAPGAVGRRRRGARDDRARRRRQCRTPLGLVRIPERSRHRQRFLPEGWAIPGQSRWPVRVDVSLDLRAHGDRRLPALRRGRADDRSWYCLCLGLPAIVLFTAVPLWGDRGLPHWQMAGWLMLFPVLGDHLAREAAVRSRPRTWAITSAALLVVLAFLFVGHTRDRLWPAAGPGGVCQGRPDARGL